MARMNQTRGITGRPRSRKPDTHAPAVREAFDAGLAEYAAKNAAGEPLLYSAKQRRAAERAKARAENL